MKPNSGVRRLCPQVSAEKLDIDDKASPAVFGFYVNANALAKATLTGVWGR